MVIELVDGGEFLAPPVFVDLSGRRGRRVAWVGRALVTAVLGYLFLLGAGMARAPWVPRLGLPGLGPLVVGSQPVRPPVLPNAVQSPAPDLRTSPAASPHTPSGSSTSVAIPAGGVTSQPSGRSTAPGQNKTTTVAPPTTIPAESSSSSPPTSKPHPGRGPSTTNPHRQ